MFTDKRCVVAVSGGVDSAVAALLLMRTGCEVTGVTLRMKPGALADGDIADAQKVCDSLGIRLEVLDVREAFRSTVTDAFCREYISGRTPSPCVLCNPALKFRKILEYADGAGIEHIATGHYATVEKGANGEYLLKKSKSKKDQSYFLSGLNSKILARTLFPLGGLDKSEVRAIARDNGLTVSEKRDSTEVCFIPGNDYAAYLEHSGIPLPPKGDFVDAQGNSIGTHGGIYKYTIGQRKGLGAFGEPKFVTAVNARSNTVALGSANELLSDEIRLENMSWISGTAPAAGDGVFFADVKIRSAAPCANAKISLSGNGADVCFFSPQRAPAPGQAAVMYDGDTVLGFGTITSRQVSRR